MEENKQLYLKSGTNTKKSKYELHEIYSQNENGDAEIEYILYKVVVE